MDLFWDTSAVVPLILQEKHTHLALEAFAQTERFFAWDWMAVETEAALGRRQARTFQWEKWQELSQLFQWIHLPTNEWNEIRKRNRRWMLRAADAAHLYAFSRLADILPEARLVTFDEEQRRVATTRGFRLV